MDLSQLTPEQRQAVLVQAQQEANQRVMSDVSKTRRSSAEQCSTEQSSAVQCSAVQCNQTHTHTHTQNKPLKMKHHRNGSTFLMATPMSFVYGNNAIGRTCTVPCAKLHAIDQESHCICVALHCVCAGPYRPGNANGCIALLH